MLVFHQLSDKLSVCIYMFNTQHIYNIGFLNINYVITKNRLEPNFLFFPTLRFLLISFALLIICPEAICTYFKRGKLQGNFCLNNLSFNVWTWDFFRLWLVFFFSVILIVLRIFFQINLTLNLLILQNAGCRLPKLPMYHQHIVLVYFQSCGFLYLLFTYYSWS